MTIKNLKVLIVDDDDVIVFLHELLVKDNAPVLGSLGFENGKKALDYLNAESDNNQAYLILLDINMPVMNGWQLLDSIQSASYADNVFVIMITSSVDYEDRDKANRYSQVVDYCEKPLSDKSFNAIMQSPRLSPYLDLK